MNRILIITTLFSIWGITYVAAQKCPFNWHGNTQTSAKCFRFVTDTMTWQDARDYCQMHGGDLARLDTIIERNWIFKQLDNIRQNKHIDTSNWWVGLNNREFLTTWEWADGTALASRGLISWAPGTPDNANGSERCGEINGQTFNDEDCSDQNKFICYRDRGVPLTCDADHGWQPLNGACYKVYIRHLTWNAAKIQCDQDGASLATIDSKNDEIAMHAFASNNHASLWFALRTVQVSPSQANWTWANGTLLTSDARYWHGVPHVDRNQLNNTCAAISNLLPMTSAWTSSRCGVTRPFVCRKPQGVCLPGWLGHRTTCYQFNAQYRIDFWTSVDYCRSQGATLVKILGDSDQQFINSYLDEMKGGGADSLWIGASDNGRNTFTWADGTRITYQNWANLKTTPNNTANVADCVFITTTNIHGFWQTTNNCLQTKSFICSIPMGRSVKLVTTPRPYYSCPTNWIQDGQSLTCFLVVDAGRSWSASRTFCQQTSGADLAVVTTSHEQGTVNGMAKPGVIYWIGLNDRTKESVYVWNDNVSRLTNLTFTNWKRGEPSVNNSRQNCVAIMAGQWTDIDCAQRKSFFCSKLPDNILPLTPSPTPRTDWTIKCGIGWQSNPATDFCYIFVDQPLSWLDALNQCHDFQGSLVSIESFQEQNYLAGNIHIMNSIAVWIGANKRNSMSGWQWTSRQPFAYMNWAQGQPNGIAGQGSDCVAMYPQSAKWDDVSCFTRNGYICEKKGNIPPTAAPPATSTITLPAGMVLGCQLGWLPFRNNCYKITAHASTWKDADVFCGKIGGKLASILDQNEQNFIVGNLPKPAQSWDGYWIGLNDIQTENRFQWSDGKNVTYTHWDANEPNNYQNRNEDCVELTLSVARWNDEPCSTVNPGFICKADMAPVSANQSPYQIGCPLYSLGYGPYCYKQVTNAQQLTWFAAKSSCKTRTNGNGTLAVINDGVVQAFMASSLVWKSGYFWIGLSDIYSSGTYKWVNGVPLTYTNWHYTHTGNEKLTCVAMRTDMPTGLWENLDCTSSQQYICQFPRQGYTIPPMTTVSYYNVTCPNGWVANQGFCYTAFANTTTRKTWMEASAYCHALGGDLPSFHRYLNDSFLATMLLRYSGMRFWIGLNDRDTEAGYKWTDGSALDYTNWNPGEPNDYHKSEDCVEYVAGQNKWNDNNCYNSESFICVLPKGQRLPTVTEPPTGAPSPKCGSDPKWLFYNNSCYMISPDVGVNATLSWYNAGAVCNGNGANLASIHNIDENSFLLGIIGKLSQQIFWIGFNELNLNHYQWTDGTPIDFINWGFNEPNNAYGAERCVAIRTLSGIWSDNQCSETFGYICKKPANGIPAFIPKPSPFPSGGCLTGFTRVPGGRNKCFYIGGVKSGDASLNWTAARDFCRKFGPGVDIASIENFYEQEFALSMSSNTVKRNMWIGLNDVHTNNRFYWQDNSPVIYTNWDNNEPTSGIAQSKDKEIQNCVMIVFNRGHEGKWADTGCAQNMAYVCQSRQDPSITSLITAVIPSCGYLYQGACYRVGTTPKTWSDAQSDCLSSDGKLVSIVSIYESAFVATLVSSNVTYWIGLSDTKVKGLYSWSDGLPVTFTNWGWQEPSYGLASTGCVFADTNARWNDTDCTMLNHYVCKTFVQTVPPVTMSTLGQCSDSSWLPYGSYCYYVSVNNGRSWPEANYVCGQMGMDLVSVHSTAEMTFILTSVQHANATNPHYKPNIWIGLSQGGLSGSYTWSDNSPVNYVNWSPGQPTQIGVQGQVEQCIEFDKTTGTWNDISCFSIRGFVCKSLKSQNTGLVVSNTVLSTPSINVDLSQSQSRSPNTNQVNTMGNTVSTSKSTSEVNGGGIAAIILSVLLVVTLVALGLVYLKRAGKLRLPNAQNHHLPGIDNAVYDRSAESVTVDTSINNEMVDSDT